MSKQFSTLLITARGDVPIAVIHRRMAASGSSVNQQTVYRWFNGEGQPALRHLEALFAALEMTDHQRRMAVEAAGR